MRMRTRYRVFDVGQLDVHRFGEFRVVLKGRADAMQPCRVERWRQDDALGVADAHRNRLQLFACDVECHLTQVFDDAHVRPKHGTAIAVAAR